MRIFLEKSCKIAERRGSAPESPLASGGWGLCPQIQWRSKGEQVRARASGRRPWERTGSLFAVI